MADVARHPLPAPEPRRHVDPAAFVASCRRGRPTKHLHGWHAYDLADMVERLMRPERELLAEWWEVRTFSPVHGMRWPTRDRAREDARTMRSRGFASRVVRVTRWRVRRG